jgi:hypothetical protein
MRGVQQLRPQGCHIGMAGNYLTSRDSDAQVSIRLQKSLQIFVDPHVIGFKHNQLISQFFVHLTSIDLITPVSANGIGICEVWATASI